MAGKIGSVSLTNFLAVPLINIVDPHTEDLRMAQGGTSKSKSSESCCEKHVVVKQIVSENCYSFDRGL